MKPFLTAAALTFAIASIALALTAEEATAKEPSPELREVQQRIEAKVDARLHTILDGFLADQG